MRSPSIALVQLIAVALLQLSPGRSFAQDPASPRKTENVFLVTIDGMRWQEVFGGADATILENKAAGRVRDLPGTRAQFWRNTPQERREALMPFIWKAVAKQGQIFGDPSAHCSAQVTNGKKFSYPGYSEMLCGFADPRIDSNNKIPNPNVSVLEWLNARPGFEKRVASYGAWDVLPFILNTTRSHLPAHSGWAPIDDVPLTPIEQQINDLIPDLPHIWDDDAFDALVERGSMEYVKKHHPRVMYIMFGETDEWGHERRYDCYLEAAHRSDRFFAGLWEILQSTPQYAGKTSLVITTDHGRGSTPFDWTDHGARIKGAEDIWIAVIGPDTPALGVRKDLKVTQSQVAATLAALLGEDYHSAVPQSAPPLPDVVATMASK